MSVGGTKFITFGDVAEGNAPHTLPSATVRSTTPLYPKDVSINQKQNGTVTCLDHVSGGNFVPPITPPFQIGTVTGQDYVI